MDIVTPFVAAFHAHQWVLLAALAVGLFIALAKQSQLGDFISAHLPKAAIPAYSILLGVLGMSAAEIIAGGTWQKAIIDGINAGILAVFGHEILIEGLRKGLEIIPKAKAPPPKGPTGPAGGSTCDNKPATDTAVTKPALRDVFARRLLFVGSFLLCFGLAMSMEPACTPQEAKAAQAVIDDAFSLEQLTCLEIKTFSTSDEAKTVCKITQQLSPGAQAFLDQLLAQKIAAKKVGFEWKASQDAGTQDAASGG